MFKTPFQKKNELENKDRGRRGLCFHASYLKFGCSSPHKQIFNLLNYQNKININNILGELIVVRT